MYENNEILVPNMQREFVWDSTKSSRLIESIIIGLPIPPLFLLEIENNTYEIIDGYQRLTTLYNYITGKPWNYNKSIDKERKNLRSSILVKNNIISELAGKSFKNLSDEHKRKIKRSTIPLIEFKQLDPDNSDSKYLIFERINTGSEKLNEMQIRKVLAYGKFIENLYKYSNNNKKYMSLFSKMQIKKDLHVEAFLRIIVMSDVYYKRFKPEIYGINKILNEYVEKNNDKEIEEEYFKNFERVIDELFDNFNKENLFKRVNKDGKYEGLLNISILESLIGIMLECRIKKKDYFLSEEKYLEVMKKIYIEAIENKKINPFSTSTGSEESIKKRFLYCEEIIGVLNNG